jgi:hypothetical protein
MVSIDDGRQIERSDEQFWNAIGPNPDRRDPRSKVKLERNWQPMKQYREIVRIDEGRQID